ncbi:hypothetical protein BOX37_03105 [Nocardia mangyaensis]|uniref:DUF2530 domain-containing protein n=1 Tax=Nocardia mangyaensis TaxID=2213200 RepID=A0A1J0VM75_9NOCA|nr:DUF2530 domain-containing protein [Nocardia mangyaensis]APE33120.1 hypothetical protein BOX37_03105 [Nocardia mangyaensis]
MDAGPVSPEIPQLPRFLVDPRPVVLAGFAAWALATVLVWLVPNWADARPVCVMGLVVGVLGVSIYLAQRRSARRGDKGAQVGIDTD